MTKKNGERGDPPDRKSKCEAALKAIENEKWDS